jgi:phosphoglycerate kinase
MSHLGEPQGKRVESLALGKVREKLFSHLGYSAAKAKGKILLLENLRFHKEEEKNDKEFAKALSKLGDMYINDAFSVSHRSHASITEVAEFLPSGIGLLFEKELATLERFSLNPSRPFLVIVGGKKAENKLSFVSAISKIADVVLLGNLLASEKEKFAPSFDGAPRVHHGANSFSSFKNPLKVVSPLDGEFDIGPQTLKLFTGHIQKAKSIFWTGPLGQVEKKEYAKGSIAIAKAIGESKAFSVVGGGDLVGFLRSFHLEDKFSYLSTAGGAALAFLSGEQLPGLKVLGYYDE